MKLYSEFDEFHNDIKASYTDELKNKKEMFQKEIKDKFPEKLGDKGIEIKKSELNFFLQGSYASHTAINTSDNNIDLDMAVTIPLDIDAHGDCRKIKGCLRDSIDRTNRTIEFKKPCLTVTYLKDGEEDYHIDFPLYAVDQNQNYYLASGKESSEDYEWQGCDPKGLNEYFQDILKDNPQLRRIVRYLKKWKLNVFNDSNEMPPSIAMCIFACENYQLKQENGKDDDLEALYHIAKKMSDSISDYVDDPMFNVYLPTEPRSDTMSKINSNKEYRKKFKNKVKNFELQLRNAINAEDDYTAAEYVQSMLGEDFELPEKQVDASENKYARTSQFG